MYIVFEKKICGGVLNQGNTNNRNCIAQHKNDNFGDESKFLFFRETNGTTMVEG